MVAPTIVIVIITIILSLALMDISDVVIDIFPRIYLLEKVGL